VNLCQAHALLKIGGGQVAKCFLIGASVFLIALGLGSVAPQRDRESPFERTIVILTGVAGFLYGAWKFIIR
jgi:hypothetical protein